ncbi:MAG TPA: hypothetical protein DDW83_05945 [Peptococcaceae bacterium]|jgi:TM2 domain-containing membrane protein YozV|nr:hypothetical protein [Peptococcaceae bacterium]
MYSKSKFLTFILSFIPGLSHLYLGFAKRALIFFGLFFGTIFGMIVLSGITGGEIFMLLAFALPLIWFFALLDAFSLIDKVRLSANSDETHYTEIETFSENKKMITAALSLVPGAGHMYLGYLKEGAFLMTLFFFAAFLMGWLHMSMLLFILPVVWFYSLFDALQRVEAIDSEVPERRSLINWMESHPRLIGWSLIILGLLVILERHITPLLTPEIYSYLQTAVVAVILIAGGIKLIAGSKVESGNSDSQKDSKEKGRDEQCGSGE